MGKGEQANWEEKWVSRRLAGLVRRGEDKHAGMWELSQAGACNVRGAWVRMRMQNRGLGELPCG